MAAKIMTYRSAKNVFLYKFSYLSSFGFFKETMMSDTSNNSSNQSFNKIVVNIIVNRTIFAYIVAAGHGDELTYLFHTHLYEHKQLANVESQHMIDIMTKMWTNFARDW